MAENAKVIVNFLKQQGVEASLKTSRYQTSIKAVEVSISIPIGDFLKSLKINGSITDLTQEEERNISGRYKSKMITLKGSVSTLKKDAKFFLVNTFSDKGTLKSKALAPEKLGLTRGPFTSVAVFDKAVVDGINNLNVDADIKHAMAILFEQVRQDKTDFPPALTTLMGKIRSGDVQVIGKDYGEVLSLRWVVNNTPNVIRFGFSESIQAALIDFFVVRRQGNKEIHQDYSAKYEEGGAPSIKSVVGSLDSIYKSPTAPQKAAIDVLKVLGSSAKMNSSMRIVDAAQTVSLAGTAELKAIVGVGTRRLTVEAIADKVKAIAQRHNNVAGRIAEFRSTFEPFFTKINKKATDDSLKVVFASKTYPKFHSPIVSPFGYKLVEYLNATPIYQEMLNLASRQSKVSQVYLNLKSGKIDFQEKTYKDGVFRFEYGSNAKDSDNTGIKFSMLRTK